ncbi:MAG: TonB family protein [Thermoanaerobaculia bacterium]
MITILGAVILATLGSDFENPKSCSPSGELCVVTRLYPEVADFEGVTYDEYWRRHAVDEWLNEYPNADPEPVRGALYRRWPSGYQELLSEFALLRHELDDQFLVADDGSFVTYDHVGCGAKAELLTIRTADGAIVRTLLARDVFTKNDQQWLCRGVPDEVRWSIRNRKLHATILVNEGKEETLDIDLATGTFPPPERDLCPAPLVVTVAGMDPLLDRAVVRVMPEYPELASRARVSGSVWVDLIVDATGHVQSARVQPLPFGIDEAVKTAIAKWEFAPAETSVAGSMFFRFEIIRQMPVTTNY